MLLPVSDDKIVRFVMFLIKESQGATMDDDFDYEAFKLALDELTEGKIISFFLALFYFSTERLGTATAK